MQCWMSRLSCGDTSPFNNLTAFLDTGALPASEKEVIMTHLSTLRIHLNRYFPEAEDIKWLVSPFHVDTSALRNGKVQIEEEFLELRADTARKTKFDSQSLVEFWMDVATSYPRLFERAIDILLPFPTTYVCEQGFSALSYLKNKFRNRLDVSADLRLFLSSTEPRIDELANVRQSHPSH